MNDQTLEALNELLQQVTEARDACADALDIDGTIRDQVRCRVALEHVWTITESVMKRDLYAVPSYLMSEKV